MRHARYCWLLLAEGHLTRRLFAAMVRRIAAVPVATGYREAMGAAKSGEQEARVGELSMECTEKAGLAVLGWLRQGDSGAWWS
jgi:hypothetical protein